MCACDRDGLCPACAEREAAEWEPDPRADDERERLERVGERFADEGPIGLAAFYSARQA